MKYIRLFLWLILACFIGLLALTAPVAKKLATCLTSSNSALMSTINQSKEQKWSKELICKNGKPALDNLQACYTHVEQESILPVKIIIEFAKVLRPNTSGGDINSFINLHNEACKEYPETQIPTQLATETKSESSEWKVFNGSDFDLTLKYPNDWEVATGYAQNGTFDFECQYIESFLKNSTDCTGTHKSPMLLVRPLDGYKNSYISEGLILWGPTSGLGGGCPECTLENKVVKINNKDYTIPVKIAPKDSQRSMYSTFPDGGIFVDETGTKSIWSKFDLELDTNNLDTYNTIIKIVESIRPN